MDAPTATPVPVPSRPCDRERALTTIELMMVLVIVAIIGGVAVGSLRSGQANGALAQGRAMARTLAEGVEQFRRDHGGRLPRAVASVDWAGASPVDAANGNRPYVRTTAIEPLALRQGYRLVDGAGSARAGSGVAVEVGYVRDEAAGLYAFVVQDVLRNRADCHVTNAGPDSAGRAFTSRLPSRRAC